MRTHARTHAHMTCTCALSARCAARAARARRPSSPTRLEPLCSRPSSSRRRTSPPRARSSTPSALGCTRRRSSPTSCWRSPRSVARLGSTGHRRRALPGNSPSKMPSAGASGAHVHVHAAPHARMHARIHARIHACTRMHACVCAHHLPTGLLTNSGRWANHWLSPSDVPCDSHVILAGCDTVANADEVRELSLTRRDVTDVTWLDVT